MEAWKLVQNVENAVRMGLEEAGRKRSECEQEMEALRRQVDFQNEVYLQKKEMAERQHQAVQQLLDASQRKEQECHYLDSSYVQLARAFQSFAPAPPFPMSAADRGMGLSFSNNSCVFGAQLQFSSLLSEQSTATAEALSPQGAAAGVLLQAGVLDAGAPCHGQLFVAPSAVPALNAALGVLPVPACVKTEPQEQQWRSFPQPGVEEKRGRRRRRGNFKTGVQGIEIICLSEDEFSDEQPVPVRPPVSECVILSSEDEPAQKQRRVAIAQHFTLPGCGHGLASTVPIIVCTEEDASGREDMGFVEVPIMEAHASASQLPDLSDHEDEMRHRVATGGSAEEAATLLVHGTRQDMDVDRRASAGGTITAGMEEAELAKQVKGGASCISVTQSPAKDSGAVLGDSAKKGLPGATSPVGRGKPHSLEGSKWMAGWKKSQMPHMGARHLKKSPLKKTGEPHPESGVTKWGKKETRTGQVHAGKQPCSGSGLLEGRQAYDYTAGKGKFRKRIRRKLAEEVLLWFPGSPVVIRITKPADFHLKSWSDVGSLNSEKFQNLFSAHWPQLAAKLLSKSLQSKAKTADSLDEIGEIANAFQLEAFESADSNSKGVRGKVKTSVEKHVRSCKEKQEFQLNWSHQQIVGWETNRVKTISFKDRKACSDHPAQDFLVREKPPAENGLLPQGLDMVGHSVHVRCCGATSYNDKERRKGHVVHYSVFDGQYVVIFEDGELRSINRKREQILPP